MYHRLMNPNPIIFVMNNLIMFVLKNLIPMLDCGRDISGCKIMIIIKIKITIIMIIIIII